jgi:hypothetical protein
MVDLLELRRERGVGLELQVRTAEPVPLRGYSADSGRATAELTRAAK